MWTAISKAEELSNPHKACFNSKALQDEHGEITLIIRRRPGSILNYMTGNQLWGSLGSPSFIMTQFSPLITRII